MAATTTTVNAMDADDNGINTLPPEVMVSITARLGDRDLCRARAAHRCFRVDSDETMAKRADRWRGEKTPERFCAVGLVEALEILHNRGVAMGPGCAKAAASAGHINVLAFLRRSGTPFDTMKTLDITSLFTVLMGEMRYKGFTPATGEIVSRVIMTLAFGSTPDAERVGRRTMSLADMAARNGHLDAMVWLVRVGGVMPTTMAMDCAAARGHIEVVRWLYENCDCGCTTAAMDLAAIGGRLDVVTFLQTHRTEGCTTAAMDGAAAGGHVDVVAFLHEHCVGGCTTAAIDSAATAGHMSTVRFLCENRVEGFTRATIHEAEAAGHTRIASYLERRVGSDNVDQHTIHGPFAPCTDDDDGDHDDDDDGNANRNDTGAGGADTATQLAGNDTGDDLRMIFVNAILKGDIATMDRIHREGAIALDDSTPRAYNNYWMMASMVGRLDVLAWLDVHNVGGRDCGALTVALVAEHLDAARWLYARGVRDGMAEMIDDAAAEGEADPVRAVYDQYASLLGSVTGVADMVAQVRQLAAALVADDAPTCLADADATHDAVEDAMPALMSPPAANSAPP
nr:Ankyrin repeat domain containing protein [Pandoravirus aubagnensis]